MLTLILALALAQQSGIPTRGAGGTSSVQSLSRYGYDAGPVRRCAYGQSGSASLVNAGWVVSGSCSTITLTTPTATSLYTASSRVRCNSSAAINSSVSMRSARDAFWRGNAANLGGFHAWLRWASEVDTGTTSVFAGIRTGTAGAALLCATAPTSVTDGVFMECTAPDTNFSICSNDNTGSATCSSLGADFPCATTPLFYDIMISAAANASSISYLVVNLMTGASANGTLTSDLPRNTVFLGWETNVCNGANGGAVTIGFELACTTQR